MLRGINVSGQKLIKMNALKNLYESLGFEEIDTYVQSGNVVFKSVERDTALLALVLSDKIKEVYGFDVDVIVKTMDEYQLIVDQNPLVNDSDKDLSSMYVTFLSSIPEKVDLKALESKRQGDEVVEFFNEVIYLYCPGGYGKTKLTNNFFESKLKVVATTRNWKTVSALLEIALRK
jgi:uncharacterized protein (DUF1697 family)